MEQELWLPTELWYMINDFLPKHEIAFGLTNKFFRQLFNNTKNIKYYKEYLCGLAFKKLVKYVDETYAQNKTHYGLYQITTREDKDPRSGCHHKIAFTNDPTTRWKNFDVNAPNDEKLRSLLSKILDPKKVFKGHHIAGLREVCYCFGDNIIRVYLTHMHRKRVTKERRFIVVDENK